MAEKKAQNDDAIGKITDFLYETGQLKRVKRSGWWLIGVDNPENVAEHSFRAAVVGYFLAKMERVDTDKVVQMCLFNDLHESRINDLHKVGHRYIDFREAETKANREQTSGIGDAGREIFSLHEEFQAQKTRESIVARDADLLENALQAREYMKVGYADAQNWIDNIWKIIATESGKKLLCEIEKTDPNDWWKGLKRIER
ncbi:HAD family hydrolase [Candidatus Woesearchaeota archaeon CG10_big_fil_rev_8_21_14_0_10_44_13]|nr:MAG: HAD family hydrolase [Candidatus Woesearchaeota archaeon CG10_big_fil_rev_8_21_14_0_10_44_13]